MFCKYCGKEAGSNDVCEDCKKTISEYMAHNAANIGNINVTVANPPEPYDADASVGFRTGKTWKKVVACFYYIPVFCAVVDEFMSEGWFNGLYMLLWAIYFPFVIDLATNREKYINKWLKGKNIAFKIAAIVGCAIILAFVIQIIMYAVGNAAYGKK